MDKQYNIRWKKSDEEELKRVIRNYNAKINRLAKKNPAMKNALPEKILSRDYNELKNMIVTRKDFNRELNALKRFSNKGSEDMLIILDDGRTVNKDVYERNPDRYSTTYATPVTRWEKNEINRRVAIINQKRAVEKEKIENIEQLYKGQKLGYKKGDVGMGNNLINALKPINGISRGMNTKDIKAKMRDVRRQSMSGYFDKRTALMRENYIKGLQDHYSDTDIKDVVEHINELSDEEFLNTFYAEKNASFEIASPKKANKHIERENLSALRYAWLGDE